MQLLGQDPHEAMRLKSSELEFLKGFLPNLLLSAGGIGCPLSDRHAICLTRPEWRSNFTTCQTAECNFRVPCATMIAARSPQRLRHMSRGRVGKSNVNGSRPLTSFGLAHGINMQVGLPGLRFSERVKERSRAATRLSDTGRRHWEQRAATESAVEQSWQK